MVSVFDNTFLNLSTDFFTEIRSEKMPSPKVLFINKSLAETLNIKNKYLNEEYLSGNKLISGSKQIAQKYAGHQFGNFVPSLGDGRAALLGEIVDKNNERKDIQLKGSGKTPFSRMGDGRACLGPVIREHLISESFFHLGIPSSRSLAIVLTGEKVIREKVHPGALLVRVSSSHIRIGTFEYFAYRNDIKNLKKLADYCIDRHYPEINGENKYLDFLKKITRKQASLISKWTGVGFIHGVMNTDNSAISGETIDFGPCAFLEKYESNKVFSSIDLHGRYSFSNQPYIIQWNLSKLAECLINLIEPNDLKLSISKAEEVINHFPAIYKEEWIKVMKKKFGLKKENESDEMLFSELFEIMEKNAVDFTLAFRFLKFLLPGEDQKKWIELFKNKNDDNLKNFIKKFQKRIIYENNDLNKIKEIINKNNPILIPRNHNIEKIINEAVSGEFKSFHEFNKLIKIPYSSSLEDNSYSRPALPEQEIEKTFCGT